MSLSALQRLAGAKEPTAEVKELRALRIEIAAQRGIRLPTVEEETAEAARQDTARAKAWLATPEGQKQMRAFDTKVIFWLILIFGVLPFLGWLLPLLSR